MLENQKDLLLLSHAYRIALTGFNIALQTCQNPVPTAPHMLHHIFGPITPWVGLVYAQVAPVFSRRNLENHIRVHIGIMAARPDPDQPMGWFEHLDLARQDDLPVVKAEVQGATSPGQDKQSGR